MMTLRPAVWILALASALTITVAPKFAVAFQSTQGMEHGRGRDQSGDQEWGNGYSNNPHYQQGISQGRQDAAKNRDHRYRFQTNNDRDRRAYEAGYDLGYRDGNRDGNYNGQYGRNGPYGRNDNVAAQMGAQDGLSDGRRDYQKQHSYRPTAGDNYVNATRGFAGGLGQAAYQEAYRQAYLTAYRQGYGQQGSDRYGPNGPYGQNGNLAAQMGSQDGLNDGRTDRQTGHSNRPTQGDNYKNATRGFTGGAGETGYKAAYRQAYLPAYQQGYTSQNNPR